MANNEIELKDFILTVHADKYEIKKKRKGFLNFVIGYFTSIKGFLSLFIASIVILALYLLFSFIFHKTFPLKWLLLPIVANIPLNIIQYFRFQKDKTIEKKNVLEAVIDNKNRLVISHYNYNKASLVREILTLPKDEIKKKEATIRIKELNVLQEK